MSFLIRARNVILSVLALSLATGLLFFYTHYERHQHCAHCVSYAMYVESMMFEKPENRENTQFFHYALDTACRGSLLTGGHCTSFRRKFLDDPERYKNDIRAPYPACRAIEACS
ncbi:hypothetical protein ASPWEDRAFT_177490 [Aspergillus wentii DTO 134E9]|uniref:Saposin B-type domain-containing protein n=1 Tax=Aspergillus wentii DTO 134E9 TaxID=1073089 RepID=A0A1L9R4B5_ASPWE|nr:uncharacterized protein ASPWEDRAFT_177490 [Aspergillus wentii DTO 134E9]KAI9927033.1 hypothetical protein MW887_003414 [Aspergillus wentii]OJJ29750.1 hypothetical protein ASPWEDRAFT_177490 [Aspergillus wentii DTO 134E9]